MLINPILWLQTIAYFCISFDCRADYRGAHRRRFLWRSSRLFSGISRDVLLHDRLCEAEKWELMKWVSHSVLLALGIGRGRYGGVSTSVKPLLGEDDARTPPLEAGKRNQFVLCQ